MDRKKSTPITPELAATIKYLHKELKLYQHQIASVFGVNQGRVSEVMTGKRFPEVEAAMLVPVTIH